MGGPCGWSITKCGCGDCWTSYTPEVRTRAANLATWHMWAATGRRFGLCEVTVQPCNQRRPLREYQTYPVVADGVHSDGVGVLNPVIIDGEWVNQACGPACRCKSRCEVALEGPTSKDNIVSVTVDGQTVDPSAYVVFDTYLLARIDGECWPSCVDYTNQDPPDFEVTYKRGEAIPDAVQGASELLACEYAKLCTGGACRLPNRVTRLTRQGVDVEMESQAGLSWQDLARTGIPEVDRVIALVNPGRRASRPQVHSPDLPTHRVLT